MQQVLERQPKIIAPAIDEKEYAKAWRDFWKMGEELRKRWRTKKKWVEILREERK